MPKLNAEEREHLQAECEQRLLAVNQQGFTVPGIEVRLVVSMLHQLLTPEQEGDAMEAWLYWFADQLDQAEAAMRKRALAITGNGRS